MTSDNHSGKLLVAQEIVRRIQPGQTIGIGSGTTVEAAFELIRQRVSAEGLQIFGVPTSYKTALLAEQAGICVVPLSSERRIDWAFDGADEVDPQFRLVKGRGAALLSEKIIAQRAGGISVLVTEEKLVPRLGARMPVPIEVIPDATNDVLQALRRLGIPQSEVRVSPGKFGPLVTERGNFLIDATINENGAELEPRLKQIVGVVETGFFIGLTKEVITLRDGQVTTLRPS